MTRSVYWRFACAAVLCLTLLPPPVVASEQEADNVVALSLAAMLRAARTVISNNQDKINDPKLGDKGLTADYVVSEAVERYKKTTGNDPRALDPASRHGKLLRAQIDAIAEVMNNNQPTLNAMGVGFKGFIPATFARLVNEAF